MKLKSKNLNWLAGRPVVILGDITSKKLNVHVDERISIRYKGRKIYAVVDIFPNLVKSNEIGLSNEISSMLENKSGEDVDIGTAEMFAGARIVRKKMAGEELTKEEIKILVSEISNNNLTEAEIAYFVAAEKIKGLSHQEIVELTEAMIKTGKKLDFGKNEIIADKHCIGGIAGNRTTPIVASICAAAGLKMPKSSSRAITSAAGTADTVETIANVELSLEEIKEVVNKTNACLVWGGSLGLAPSDDKIIHIERVLNLDVEPQLLASILSKKIAAGSNRILIDIPYGSGKMQTLSQAKSLGEKFKSIARHFDVRVRPIYTYGIEPIGNGIGPVLEMQDILLVLRNDPSCPKDLKEKSILLASTLMSMCGIFFAKSKARKILESGLAYKKFKEIINAQNKSKDFDKRVAKLRLAKYKKIIYAEKTGKIIEIHNSKINSICRIVGTPETKTAGIYLYKHLGPVNKGDKLMTIYSENEQRLEDALKFVKEFEPIKIE